MRREEMTLNLLPLDSSATVARLTCQGADRRRLFDLGILPGTRIQAVSRSPLGDPTAYRVRGAVIALRREQAEQIFVIPEYPQTAVSPVMNGAERDG
jgi:Fe2+ transport system protein FeoA